MKSIKNAILAAIVATLAVSASAQPFRHKTSGGLPPGDPLWTRYWAAVFDSSVYETKHLRPLRPLVADADGYIRVATATHQHPPTGPYDTADQWIWVTGVPEVQTKCRAFTGDVQMQVRQLLGLPPDADTPFVIVFKVKPDDVFRPAVDPAISTGLPCGNAPPPPAKDCGNVFPPNTAPEHFQWMAENELTLHEKPDGYPWTHLGYTYNWARGQDRYGASEYIVRQHRTVEVVAVYTTEKYCEK